MVARYRGYIRAVEEAGAERVVVVKGVDLLDSRHEVTGVYCALSYDGPDLLCECIDRGMRVPDDLSIVGQDDAREKQIVRPALTTVNMRSKEMGKMAAQTVISKIEGKNADNVMLEPELVLRESTGEPGR